MCELQAVSGLVDQGGDKLERNSESESQGGNSGIEDNILSSLSKDSGMKDSKHGLSTLTSTGGLGVNYNVSTLSNTSLNGDRPLTPTKDLKRNSVLKKSNSKKPRHR